MIPGKKEEQLLSQAVSFNYLSFFSRKICAQKRSETKEGFPPGLHSLSLISTPIKKLIVNQPERNNNIFPRRRNLIAIGESIVILTPNPHDL